MLTTPECDHTLNRRPNIFASNTDYITKTRKQKMIVANRAFHYTGLPFSGDSHTLFERPRRPGAPFVRYSCTPPTRFVKQVRPGRGAAGGK